MEQVRIDLLVHMVEKHRDLILKTEETIWNHPETGYREWKTTAYLEKVFEDLGYSLVKAGNIPGFYADLDTGRPGPKVAILGEMDSLIVKNHPDADPQTGAVHACGHHAQCATLVGAAAALKEPGALDGLCGSIRLIAVPAEELIELGFRETLREQGIIRYYGGKVEFLYRGYLDGVDMALLIHSGKQPEGKYLGVNPGCNGCVVKNITYKGVSAHAGGAPQNGINALYAATSGINAVNALRETFVDNDHIRFHPIITEAGLAVNAIPETAKVESYVRGASYEAIYNNNKKINRALAAGAAAIGAGVQLCDRPGYFPLNNDKNLMKLIGTAMELVAGPDSVDYNDSWSTGCTDMGDLSAVMPAVHPHGAGAVGAGHGMDYYIQDKEAGCIIPAECLVVMTDLLLRDGAKEAERVIKEQKPYFKSKEEYLKAIDQFTLDRDAVIYEKNGNVILNLGTE